MFEKEKQLLWLTINNHQNCKKLTISLSLKKLILVVGITRTFKVFVLQFLQVLNKCLFCCSVFTVFATALRLLLNVRSLRKRDVTLSSFMGRPCFPWDISRFLMMS